MTYWKSRLYVKPTNGKWLPAKAFGTWNVSGTASSFSISSKLLVSTSQASSGTTGGTAKNKEGRMKVNQCELEISWMDDTNKKGYKL